MSKINVLLMNCHGLFSHLEIMLKDESNNTFYLINQWDKPLSFFSSDDGSMYKKRIARASSTYQFEIEANPVENEAAEMKAC